MRIALLVLERFNAKVNRRRGQGPTGTCWEWNGWKDKNAQYGRFRIGPDVLLAHRVSFALNNGGTVPNKLDVLHSCDNPSCVRASHLFLGTHLDNMRDAARKGRLATGIKNGQGRKVFCKRGHKLPVRLPNTKGRRCLICAAEDVEKRSKIRRLSRNTKSASYLYWAQMTVEERSVEQRMRIAARVLKRS